MTNVTEDQFLVKLYEVVYKLSGIAKTQSYRFKKEWDENQALLNYEPHLVRQIPVEKERFLNDIDYRIDTLNTVKLTFEDGFHSIKSLLEALYTVYFKESGLFVKSYSEEDQLKLKYFIAKKILGDLVQYNTLEHDIIPLKYNIMASNYYMMKLKGLRDTEIQRTLDKINIKLTLPQMKKIMEEIVDDGFITKNQKGRYLYYTLIKDIELSEEGDAYFKKTIRSLIEWPTLFWRSYYNIREINVTIDENNKDYESLNKILSRAATQGYVACHYVFKELIEYYLYIKESGK